MHDDLDTEDDFFLFAQENLGKVAFDEKGDVAAAVNIAVPFPRWSVARAKRRLTPIVRDVGKAVSKALGWRG